MDGHSDTATDFGWPRDEYRALVPERPPDPGQRLIATVFTQEGAIPSIVVEVINAGRAETRINRMGLTVAGRLPAGFPRPWASFAAQARSRRSGLLAI